MTISGNIYVKTNGAPLSNVPISIVWFRKAYCIGCTSYDVASGTSKSDGSFNFSVTIDTTFFNSYFLTVRLPSDTNYIAMPNSGGVHFVEERLYDFNATQLQNLKFEFYPKTYLTIRLHRTQNDIFDYFSVEHTFRTGMTYADYIVTGQQNAGDSIRIVPTSTDIYTKVIWTKNINGQRFQTIDSLICTKNGPNNFDINY